MTTADSLTAWKRQHRTAVERNAVEFCNTARRNKHTLEFGCVIMKIQQKDTVRYLLVRPAAGSRYTVWYVARWYVVATAQEHNDLKQTQMLRCRTVQKVRRSVQYVG